MKLTPKQHKAVMAYHEAGHAVIARVLGVGITYVTLLSPDDTAAAAVQSQSATYFADEADQAAQLAAIEKDAKVSFAGMYAQLRYRPPKGRRMPDEWDGDRDTATGFAVRAALVKRGTDLKQIDPEVPFTLEPDDAAEAERLFMQWSEETKALISEHWHAIKRVAEELLTSPILDQDDVDQLIGSADVRT